MSAHFGQVSEYLLTCQVRALLFCNKAKGCCFCATPPLYDSLSLGAGRLQPNLRSCRFPIHVFWICIFFLIFYTYWLTCIVIRQDTIFISRRTIFALSFCFIRKSTDLYSNKVTGYKNASCLQNACKLLFYKGCIVIRQGIHSISLFFIFNLKK